MSAFEDARAATGVGVVSIEPGLVAVVGSRSAIGQCGLAARLGVHPVSCACAAILGGSAPIGRRVSPGQSRGGEWPRSIQVSSRRRRRPPLYVRPVTVVRDVVTGVSQAVPLLSCLVSIVSGEVPLVRGLVASVTRTVTLGGLVVALLSDLVASVVGQVALAGSLVPQLR